MEVQQELQWFPPDQPEYAPTPELRRWWVSMDNPENPFSKFIGNEVAVRRLCRAAYTALERHNRCCRDQSFALLGPPSTGKTTIVKMFADLMDLPLVEVNPRSISTLSDLLEQISLVLEKRTIQRFDDGSASTLELVPDDDGRIVVPPCIVFIDEVHCLKNNIVQGLLKATEKKDSVMVVENGWIVDCYNICWCIATTDRAALDSAFETRFTKINLQLYTTEEIAQIVQINYPEWDDEVCSLVAKYSEHIPRVALDFAAEMQLEYNMNQGEWEDIAAIVAEDHEIDEHGMAYQRVSILSALGQGPIPRNQMVSFVNCKEEELVKRIMPPLLSASRDSEPLVKTTSKGYVITEHGIKELDKRGIKHAYGATITNRLNMHTDN